MSLFSKLFGGGGDTSSSPEADTVTYNGFQITPTPMKAGNQWRISARVEKEIGGEMKTHTLIRADELGDREAAEEASVAKAKTAIDQLGDGLFD